MAPEEVDPNWNLPNRSLEELQSTLAQSEAALAAKRQQANELATRLAEEKSRPDQIRALLSEAKATLESLEPELNATPPSVEADGVEQANRWLLEARRAARRSEARMLEQELLGDFARVSLLEAQSEEASVHSLLLASEITAIESRVSVLRQADAEKAKREAEALRRETLAKHPSPLIRETAMEIFEVAKELEGVGCALDATRSRRGNVEVRLSQL